jgi:hypothetical protein
MMIEQITVQHTHLLKIRALIYNCGEILVAPVDVCKMNSPNTNDLRITAFYNSCPFMAHISEFDNGLFGDFFQELEIAQSHTPKI